MSTRTHPGIIVVHGASDDLVEVRGAVTKEFTLGDLHGGGGVLVEGTRTTGVHAGRGSVLVVPWYDGVWSFRVVPPFDESNDEGRFPWCRSVRIVDHRWFQESTGFFSTVSCPTYSTAVLIDTTAVEDLSARWVTAEEMEA